MPDSYRDRMRQAQWVKAEARRQVAQEQAAALTELGVPCAQRSGWVVVLSPNDLVLRMRMVVALESALTNAVRSVERVSDVYESLPAETREAVEALLPAAEATLPTVTTPATEPHSGKGEGSDAHREARRRARAAFAELRRIDPPCSCPEQTYLDRVATYTAPAGVEPHAATCPRNGQLEGDRLDWLATDYPATQWPNERGRG